MSGFVNDKKQKGLRPQYMKSQPNDINGSNHKFDMDININY